MHSTLHRFRWRGFAGAALALATATSLTVASTSAEAQRARRGPTSEPIVSVYEVKTEPVRERVAAVGSGRALSQVTLTTRVAGVISEVLFQGGDRVEKDQVLVRLASEPEAIAVETAEAQRAQAFD